jgi:signal transduction histidine kinase
MDLRKFNTLSPFRQVLIAFWCATLVALSAVAGQWVLNVRLAFPRFNGIGLVGPTVSFIVTFGLVLMIRLRAQQRRKARLARAQIVADCNHEIRNALQAMIGLNYQHESVAQIEAAVRRIDNALRDLLPQLEDEDSSALRETWEIEDGKLKVKER